MMASQFVPLFTFDMCGYVCLLYDTMVLTSCMSHMSQEIHGLLRQGVSVDNISSQLSPWASALFEFLPPFIRKQVCHPSHLQIVCLLFFLETLMLVINDYSVSFNSSSSSPNRMTLHSCPRYRPEIVVVLTPME